MYEEEQTMSDVPVTRQPVPRPRWNDYQVVRRAAMNHASSILQNAPSLSQTASQPVNQLANQSVRQAERKPIPTNLDCARPRQLAKNGRRSKHKAPSKLALCEKFCSHIYLSYSLFSFINWRVTSNAGYSLGL